MLVEIALAGWDKVPFATAHAPAAQTLKSKWPWFIVALNIFGYRLAEVQVSALSSDRAVTVYLLVTATVVIAIRLWRMRALRRQRPTLDAVDNERFETLNLSEALN
jgi:hypothetical protein